MGDKYDRLNDTFLANLLVAPSVEAACEQTGIHHNTGLAWLRRPDFIQKYREAKTDIVSHAIAKLQGVTGKAVQTLEAIMDDSEAPATARVSAARVVLESSLRVMEDEEINGRLEALEQEYE